MGARKRLRAEEKKEANKTRYFARLNDCPTSPRKMKLVADMIKGQDVQLALGMLQHSPKEAAGRLYKLLLSAISNWQMKNEGKRIEDQMLYIREISVDGGRSLKRLQTAPQGRAFRIRKRSNHVTLILGNRLDYASAVENTETEKLNK
ncbi:MAG: 50S ribosomal protein L22 [Bacteroidetes bacterium]|nr:50S ribosomal protein L22 [Bacteroidota bacterium]